MEKSEPYSLAAVGSVFGCWTCGSSFACSTGFGWAGFSQTRRGREVPTSWIHSHFSRGFFATGSGAAAVGVAATSNASNRDISDLSS